MLSSCHLYAGCHLSATLGFPSDLSWISEENSSFDIIYALSTRLQWFTCVHLLNTHLTRSIVHATVILEPLVFWHCFRLKAVWPFPNTLTTLTLYQRSYWRFETYA